MPLMTNLYTGVSGLNSSQNAINITAHNLANVYTNGYVRQQAQFADQTYTKYGNSSVNTMQIGYGVYNARTQHYRDILLDMAYREQSGRGGFYIAGVIITLVLIAVSTYIQYNATFLSTYVESGVRRITLAEKLRKIPLSFFGKKDLSDLTSTIMADCAQMETASSHFIPELVGACISTAFVAIGLFFFDWRMAIAALWVLPISFIIVSCSGKVQRKLNEKQVALKMTCADGIQECLESVRDIRAYNTQEEYMKGLDEKIKAVEKHAVSTELGTAVFVGSAQMILKLGIATVALMRQKTVCTQ